MSSAHNVFDDRIFFKECSTLAHSGFNVSLIAIGEKDEIINNVNVFHLTKPKSRFERFFLLEIKLLIKAIKLKADIYHFHDPDLIVFGIIMKLLDKKVVYDMHELVYYQINDKDWLKFNLLKKIISGIYLRFEKIAVRLFDKVIIAEDGYWSYVNDIYLKSRFKFIAIRNFSIYELIEKSAANKTLNVDDEVKLVYAGGLSKIRGINEIIIAIQNIPKIKFIILGSWENIEYESICMQSDQNKKVVYIGNVRMDEVYSYLKAADIGIANLYHKPNYLNSLPIKAFEYMACGLPIIMSDFPYWIETFSGCAIFVDPLNSNDIKKAIEILIENKDLRIKLSKEGRKLVKEKYTWEAEGQILVTEYKKMLGEN